MRIVRKPVLCNYYLTYRCNASCSFCDIWEKPSPYVDLENAKSNMQALKKLGVKVIDFTGGEPLLHRHLDQLLLLAKSMGFITTVTTNCLLYPKWAEKIKGLVDMLHFSLDSPIAEEHNQWRGVKCYDKVLESIEIAKKLGERPDILFTVSEANIHHLDRMWEEFANRQQLMLLVNPIFDYNQVDNGGGLSKESLKKLYAFGKRKWVYLNKAFLKLRENGGNSTQSPVCKAASSCIVISPENKLVVPCYHLGTKDFAIENKLYELWKSAEVQHFVKLEGRLPACEGCVINCYMQPSFAVSLNKYWFYALPSTLKYNLVKGTWKNLFRQPKRKAS